MDVTQMDIPGLVWAMELDYCDVDLPYMIVLPNGDWAVHEPVLDSSTDAIIGSRTHVFTDGQQWFLRLVEWLGVNGWALARDVADGQLKLRAEVPRPLCPGCGEPGDVCKCPF